MNRRHFLMILPAMGLGACAVAPGNLSMAPNSVLLVVRHGDRDKDNLSEKGHARARALVDAVAKFELAAIHSPGLQRNLDTAAPLSAALDMPVQRIAQEAPTGPLLRSANGRAVIWIGNKGNIRTIWEDLMLSEPAPLEYGDLAIIRSDAQGTVTVEMRRFGPV